MGDARPAASRDRLPDPGPADLPHRRARWRRADRVPLRRRDQGLRRVCERGEGADPQAHRLLRRRDRAGPGRGGDAVEHEVRRVGLLVREQHQHARGRDPSLRLHRRADADVEQVRARPGPPEGEGRQPRGRGHARGARRGRLREASAPAVRGPDEDEARQPGRQGPGRADRQREAVRVPRGEPLRRASGSSRRRSRRGTPGRPPARRGS